MELLHRVKSHYFEHLEDILHNYPCLIAFTVIYITIYTFVLILKVLA